LQRVRGVLSVDPPSGASSSRRPKASTPAATAAAVEQEEVEEEEDSSPDASCSSEVISVELDEEAAAMFKKFLAGSRATEVPLWNNRMADDMPKVRRKRVCGAHYMAQGPCWALQQATMRA
jgi:hypothetical protein